jgi:hypothetical protein
LKSLYFYYRYILVSSKQSSAFKTTNKGLGVKANCNIMTMTQTHNGTPMLLPDELWGILFYIGDSSIWDRLVESNYPSLFRYKDYRGILVGPVSLLNHQCGSPLTLQGVKLRPDLKRQIPEELYNFVGEEFILVR